MMRCIKISLAFLFLACMLLSGCTSQYGHLNPNSQFAYANSNVRTLGPVQAETKKGRFFGFPSLTVEDIKGVYNEALSQKDGANILINFKEDTYWTTYPFYTKIRYVIEGEAARMTVGKQELR